jgi:hypothetical protein
MIAIVWQFEVKAGSEHDFERFYGVEGEWTAVNRHSRSYLGTSFLIEYWSEMVVYEQHKAYKRDDLDALITRRGELVDGMEPLGVFTALDVPDRAGPTWSRRG